jgi:hypothetical protein
MQHACCVYGTHCLYLETKTKKCLFPPSFRTPEKVRAPLGRFTFPVFLELWRFQKATSPFKSQPTIKHVCKHTFFAHHNRPKDKIHTIQM